jgi:hypothetical protein
MRVVIVDPADLVYAALLLLAGLTWLGILYLTDERRP